MSALSSTLDDDLKYVVTKNRFVGLWRMLKGYKFKYISANLSLGIAALAKTGTYLLLRYFIDSYFVTDNQKVALPVIAAGFLVLAAVEGGFTFISGKLAAETAEGVARRLRNYLYDHIQHLSFTFHSQTKTGELVQKATSDVEAVRRFFSDQAIGIGRIVFLFLVNFIALLNLNQQLAWISIIVVPFVVLTSVLFFRKISAAYEAYQEQDAIVSTTLQENLSGVRVVKAFARQPYEISKFDRQNWEKFVRGKKLLSIHSLFWPVSDILCGLQLIGGYYVGATMAINGTISVGTYLAYTGLITWIIFPLRNLGRLIVQMSTGLVSFDRVSEIIKEERELLDDGDFTPNESVKGDLLFDHISFQYEHAEPVLQDITFHCTPGQRIALLGSTGSGKTSLVNLLPRFYEYTGGKILLDGIELNRYSRRYLRYQIGIVEQEPFLFSRSILENITYGLKKEVSQAEIETAARAAAIHDVIMSFPEGYHTLVGEKGVTLSGGQKQRVTIARTLLKNPRILILDDSTSSVDPDTEAEIREALSHLMKNRTTFIIAHRIQSIMDSDLILVLDHGKIIQQGTHDSLITQSGIYQEIFNIQTRIDDELEQEIRNV